MPFEVDIPKLGESVNEVTVLEWLCADGDYVDKDEPICVLETDKANVDLPAPTSGVLRQLRKVDETLSVGDVLAQIEEGERPADSGHGSGVDAAEPEAIADAPEEETADSGGDVAGEGPRRCSPDEKRFTRLLPEGKFQRNAAMGDFGVSVSNNLVLTDSRRASWAPRH